MLDRLADAWRLGREWGERHADPFPRNYQVEEELSRAGLPDDAGHFRAFRDGAKNGAAAHTPGKEG